MSPINEEAAFIQCYRLLIASYRLEPDVSAEQLAAILHRVCAEPSPQRPRAPQMLDSKTGRRTPK